MLISFKSIFLWSSFNYSFMKKVFHCQYGTGNINLRELINIPSFLSPNSHFWLSWAPRSSLVVVLYCIFKHIAETMSIGFKRYWRDTEWTSLIEIMSHLTIPQGDSCIKYQEFVLDEFTVRKWYRARDLPSVISNAVTAQQKCITFKDGIVIITYTKDDNQDKW